MPSGPLAKRRPRGLPFLVHGLGPARVVIAQMFPIALVVVAIDPDLLGGAVPSDAPAFELQVTSRAAIFGIGGSGAADFTGQSAFS